MAGVGVVKDDEGGEQEITQETSLDDSAAIDLLQPRLTSLLLDHATPNLELTTLTPLPRHQSCKQWFPRIPT